MPKFKIFFEIISILALFDDKKRGWNERKILKFAIKFKFIISSKSIGFIEVSGDKCLIIPAQETSTSIFLCFLYILWPNSSIKSKLVKSIGTIVVSQLSVSTKSAVFSNSLIFLPIK